MAIISSLRRSLTHTEMPRLSQGGHKVVTRLSNGYNIVTRLLHHAWLQLTITTSGPRQCCMYIALLLGQHPNGPNGCQGCI